MCRERQEYRAAVGKAAAKARQNGEGLVEATGVTPRDDEVLQHKFELNVAKLIKNIEELNLMAGEGANLDRQGHITQLSRMKVRSTTYERMEKILVITVYE